MLAKGVNPIKQQYLITDNAGDRLEIQWDGERFALISIGQQGQARVIILNPEEALKVATFIRSIPDEFITRS